MSRISRTYTPRQLLSAYLARPSGRQRALVTVFAFCLMALAMHLANHAEVAALASGDFVGLGEIPNYMIVGAAVLGLVVAVFEKTTLADLAVTLSASPWSAFLKTIFCHLTSTMCPPVATTPRVAAVCVSEISNRIRVDYSAPSLTPDLWRTGDSPNLLYERP